MTIIATYNNFDSANKALDKLMDAGISKDHISVAALEETSKKMHSNIELKDPRRKQRGIRYSNRTVCFRI